MGLRAEAKDHSPCGQHFSYLNLTAVVGSLNLVANSLAASLCDAIASFLNDAGVVMLCRTAVCTSSEIFRWPVQLPEERFCKGDKI